MVVGEGGALKQCGQVVRFTVSQITSIAPTIHWPTEHLPIVGKLSSQIQGFFSGNPLRVPSIKKLILARLGVSRPIYVNVDSPNLGFPHFNFLGGYQWEKTPCNFVYVCVLLFSLLAWKIQPNLHYIVRKMNMSWNLLPLPPLVLASLAKWNSAGKFCNEKKALQMKPEENCVEI